MKDIADGKSATTLTILEITSTSTSKRTGQWKVYQSTKHTNNTSGFTSGNLPPVKV